MTSVYLQCDNCGTTMDRYAKEHSVGDGTFGKCGGGAAEAYARKLGWLCNGDVHICPGCVTTAALGDPDNPPLSQDRLRRMKRSPVQGA